MVGVNPADLSFEVELESGDTVVVFTDEETDYAVAIPSDDVVVKPAVLQDTDGDGVDDGPDFVSGAFEDIEVGKFVVVFGEHLPDSDDIIAYKVDIHNE